MVGDTPVSMSTVPPSKPTLSIDIASSTSSSCVASRHSLLHTNPPAPPTHFDASPPELLMFLQMQKRVETRVDSLPHSLALLADVCSSSNIRWDDDKQLHYMECDTSQFGKTPQSTPLVLEQSLTNDTVSIGALTSAQKTGVADATRLGQDTDEIYDQSEETVFLNWKEGDKSPSNVRTPFMLPIDFTPSSPTTFSQSSPIHGTCGYSSASERSMTLPVSSPDFSSLKKVACGSPEIPSQLFFAPSPTFSQNALDSSILDLPPLVLQDKALTVELSQESKANCGTDEKPKTPERSKSSSPCHAPSPLPPLPSHLELSPLSSLVSSPLTEAFEEEPPSAISSHFTIASSVLSSRSPSPTLGLTVDTYITWREKVRRASINTITNRPSNVRNFDAFQRSDTAPPEHTPRKRRRRSSPPLANPAALRNSKIMSSSRSATGREIRTLEEGTSSIENFKPVVQSKPTADSKPKKKGRRGRKAKDTLENVPEVNNLSRIPPAELTESPMTGFMVETLALSRASAMAAPELLRAVLRSQPHLKEERSEGLWLATVRCILEKVKMFGKIERKGTDAADHPLEDQWFYIPENDEEEGRAELLKGLMPKKRAVTKSSKQYYFEPISKFSRWDPEDD